MTDPDFRETGDDNDASGTDGGRTPRDGGLAEIDGAMAGITVPAYARMSLAGMSLVGAGC
ncbi:hypothetical protein ACFXHA_41895 [Nocardia sp. NPDC059240]|uniref:hypothetical protein n=1 Tax=Nocardia sp. NPDC059240 TaxID=3346786 RepID=UPI0036B89F97